MTNSTSNNVRNNEAWTMPEGLSPLATWLTNRGVDVYSLKSDRQALHFAANRANQKVKWPRRGQSCVPQLVKLQKIVCARNEDFKSDYYRERWPMANEPFLKSTGAASKVRRVDAKTYAAISKKYAIISTSNARGF